MASPVFAPQPPVPASWAPAGGWYNAGAASATSSPDQAEVDRWSRYMAYLEDLLTKTSGFERWKVNQQYQDAKKGRENAYRIAALQARTSRYGTDREAEVELAKLKEQQRQFDASHGLEQQRFGLDVAEAYTRYSSTPDMMWARADFENALGRAGRGLGPQPISSAATQPTPKTWESFSALAGFGNLPVVQAGAAGMQDATGATMSAQPAGGSGAGTDPRLKAMRAVADAIPPSNTPGNDDQDWAALNAIRNLYFAGKPGSVEALGPSRRKTAQAGLARLGYDPNLVEEEYSRSLPGQRSVRSL